MKLLRFCARQFSASVKPKVIPDVAVCKDIENKAYKPRHHPGRLNSSQISTPEDFIKAAELATEDFPIAAILDDCEKLRRHLLSKRPPLEHKEKVTITRTLKGRVFNEINLKKRGLSEEKLKQMVDNKVTRLYKRDVYNWKPVSYDTYNALLYLFARSAAEYAVLFKIFSEIAERDPSFNPKSFFDFGSGIGTATWAANAFWKRSFFEYFNVDSSSEMNDLAEILLKGGRGTNQVALKGVFYRQFLPASNVSYDLVVSAYTLLELPSRDARFETVINLWNKTQKYLVLIEQGTNAGFQIINEVRDLILKLDKGKHGVQVFSPCPHDDVCPRFLKSDGTPCNFQVNYHTLPIGAVSQRKTERYSYIVFKKEGREPEDLQWPRVIREPQVRSKHTICKMCTKFGKLEEVIFTAKKHGKNCYSCVRSSKWGDRIPVSVEPADGTETNSSDSAL